MRIGTDGADTTCEDMAPKGGQRVAWLTRCGLGHPSPDSTVQHDAARRRRTSGARILAAPCGATPEDLLGTSRDGALGLVFVRIGEVHFAALTCAMRPPASAPLADWYDPVHAGEGVALTTLGRLARDTSALGLHIRLRKRAQGGEVLLAALDVAHPGRALANQWAAEARHRSPAAAWAQRLPR